MIPLERCPPRSTGRRSVSSKRMAARIRSREFMSVPPMRCPPLAPTASRESPSGPSSPTLPGWPARPLAQSVGRFSHSEELSAARFRAARGQVGRSGPCADLLQPHVRHGGVRVRMRIAAIGSGKRLEESGQVVDLDRLRRAEIDAGVAHPAQHAPVPHRPAVGQGDLARQRSRRHAPQPVQRSSV